MFRFKSPKKCSYLCDEVMLMVFTKRKEKSYIQICVVVVWCFYLHCFLVVFSGPSVKRFITYSYIKLRRICISLKGTSSFIIPAEENYSKGVFHEWNLVWRNGQEWHFSCGVIHFSPQLSQRPSRPYVSAHNNPFVTFNTVGTRTANHISIYSIYNASFYKLTHKATHKSSYITCKDPYK